MDSSSVNKVAGAVSEFSGLLGPCPSISGPCRVSLPLKRDAKKLAFTLDDFLSRDECARLIHAAESLGFSPAGLGRSGQQAVVSAVRDSCRLISEDAVLAAQLLERLRPFLPSVWQGRRLVGLNEQLKFLRYRPGQKFVAHYDGAFCRYNTPNRTFLTVQLYLSLNHIEGGATRFVGLNDADCGTSCAPKAGRALVFQHALLHEGEEVRNGVKYTIRTDVEYGGWSCPAWLQESLGFGGSYWERRRRFLAGAAVLVAGVSVFRASRASV